MATALSQMFRYSVRNLEVVTLKEEIEHVQNFLIVEEHRFQKTFHVILDIDPVLYEEEMVKLSLQPIVENAIHHGLRKKRYEGEILIRATAIGERLQVEIIDDGAGISPDRLTYILAALNGEEYQEVSNKMGIGVNNVNRRIQLIFGESYGLTLSSELGKGTTVQMIVPRRK